MGGEWCRAQGCLLLLGVLDRRASFALCLRCPGGGIAVVQWRRHRLLLVRRGFVILRLIFLPLLGFSTELLFGVILLLFVVFESCHRLFLEQLKLTCFRFSEWGIVKAVEGSCGQRFFASLVAQSVLRHIPAPWVFGARGGVV
ncbi:hypothetical protein Bca4012_065503 [Brassica carinata]